MRRRLWRIIHDRAGYTGLPLAFKGLMIIGIVVIAGFLVYTTQKMVGELKASEARMANAYASQWKRAAESTDPGEIGYLFDQIILRSDFPIVVADREGRPLYWRGLKGIDDRDTSQATRQRVLTLMHRMESEYPPVPITYEDQLIYHLHYGNYELIRALALFPYIEVALTVLFLVIAYISFRYIKRAEQRYIWVGMAKETAHQLGTPLSSLMGWLEILQQNCDKDDASPGDSGATSVRGVTDRMQDDIARLKRVAERFSQIGSDPDRKPQPLEPIVQDVVDYFRLRLPHAGGGARIDTRFKPVPTVAVNTELIAWVLENLVKNALESVDPKTGVITIEIEPHAQGGVKVSVADNGRGITGKQQKQVFNPGFTTKKRGWGLGLTLARRIVMEYHRGDLYLDVSIPNEVTRFILHLPS
jgi:signal transduction histidine kinase